MIKAVCFDLDGVYFLNGKTNFINSLKYLGVSENEAKRVFLKSDQMNKQYKLGKMGGRGILVVGFTGMETFVECTGNSRFTDYRI